MRLEVHAWGAEDAPPVVCLHGVTGHGGRFRFLAADHLPSFRVLAPDLRGHGASSWDPPWDLATHLADVVETLDAAGLDGRALDFVGFSFGGRLALELAARRPRRVRRMALLDPAIHIPPPRARELAEGTRPDVAYRSVEEAVARRLELAPGGDRRMIEADAREGLVVGDDGLLRYRYSPSAVIAGYGEMAHEPPAVARLPILLVRAETGIVDDAHEAHLRDGAETLLEVLRVPGGHSVLWEAYEPTGAAVAAFLCRS
jgi:lipase